jgi:hypothetical protein
MNQQVGPTFLVAGAARSGTTGLVEGLRSHPQVFVTDPKEPHYFALHRLGAHFLGPGDADTINRVAVTDRDAYLRLYPTDPHSYLALGDGSVSTLYYHDESLPEILRVNPNMRIVIILRDPVERAFSSHQYMRARGFEPVEDFLAAVAQEPARKEQGWHHIWHYTSMSRYADSLAAVLATFPPEQVGVWFYENLDSDYETTVSSVLRFLAVPSAAGEGIGIPRVNISGRPRFAAIQQALWWATRHDLLRRAVKRTTTYRFRERIRRRTLQRNGVSDEARAALTPLFADDVARVRSLLDDRLGTDCPPWLQTH